MTHTHYSTGEVARLLGVAQHRIAYAHITGKCPEPPRFCGKRAYGTEDVALLAEHFGILLETINKTGELCSNTTI
jgi:DNA-binding transcriptional MerR regulator